MPEGDTIHKIANFMRPRLLGCTVEQVEVAGTRMSELQARTVVRVEAVGKHLLIALSPEDGGWVLRTHLGMQGTWHRYDAGATWQRPAWTASITLRTATEVYVCFNALTAECVRPNAIQHTIVGALGPDLLAPKCDFAGIAQRLADAPGESILVDVLLDQRIAAGLGNVYKSELLFMFKLHPLTRRDMVSPTTFAAVYERARELLLANLGGWARTTTYERRSGSLAQPGPRLWVYRRRGEPCLKCEALVAKADMGRMQRSTYWCPQCQVLGRVSQA